MVDDRGIADDYQGAKPRLWDGPERRRTSRDLLTDAEIRQNLVDALQAMRRRLQMNQKYYCNTDGPGA